MRNYPVHRGKGNPKPAAIFGVDESNVQLWHKHKATISDYGVSRKEFTGPNKEQLSEIKAAVSWFFQARHKTEINFTVVFLQNVQQLYHSSKTQFLTVNLICIRLFYSSKTVKRVWIRFENIWYFTLSCYYNIIIGTSPNV